MARQSSGTVVAAIVFLAMIAGAVYRYWPSDEREIRRHLSNLAEALSIPSNDREVTRITRFAALREYFSPDLRVRIDGRDTVGRDAVMARLEAVQPPPGGIAVEFVQIVIEPITDATKARVTLTAKVSKSEAGQLESKAEERFVSLAMTNASGDWVISTVEATIPPPGP